MLTVSLQRRFWNALSKLPPPPQSRLRTRGTYAVMAAIQSQVGRKLAAPHWHYARLLSAGTPRHAQDRPTQLAYLESCFVRGLLYAALRPLPHMPLLQNTQVAARDSFVD